MSFEAQLDAYDFAAVAEDHMGKGGMFVHLEDELQASANTMLGLEMPYGLTVRYAAKANPFSQVVKLFDRMGLYFDASSVHEARHLVDNGVDGDKISLSSQILDGDEDLESALHVGVEPVATSLRQQRMLASMGRDEAAVRVNQGLGFGGNNRTNVGGPTSSFGIWHEQLDEVNAIARKTGQTITRLHTHIGSGVDSDVWRKVMQKSLGIVDQLPDVTTLDIGGGYKVARMDYEKATDMQAVAKVFAEELERFADRTGREIALEMEPGSYLVANASVLLGRVKEIVSTSEYNFIRLNVGMNALLRPSHYGAQHPIAVLNNSEEYGDFVVVGPCCESGDILTPAIDDPEGILPRRLRMPTIGDIIAIGGAGAYGKTMAAQGYNHVPPATEIYGRLNQDPIAA